MMKQGNMTMLKYQGAFRLGDRVRAYDHMPMSDREPCFIEGTVHEVDTMCNNVMVIVVDCTYDSVFGSNPEYTRVGQMVMVPCEVGMEKHWPISRVKLLA